MTRIENECERFFCDRCQAERPIYYWNDEECCLECISKDIGEFEFFDVLRNLEKVGGTS